MPDDDTKYQPQANQMFGVGERNTLNFFFGRLSDADRAQFLSQLQTALGRPFPAEQFEALLRRVEQLESQLRGRSTGHERSGGVDVAADEVSIAGDVAGRDKIEAGRDVVMGDKIEIAAQTLSTEEREALRQIVPLLKDRVEAQPAAYSVGLAAGADFGPDDYAALAQRLREKQKPGDPLKRAGWEAPQYVPLAMKFSRASRASAHDSFERDREFGDILEAVQALRAGPGSDPHPALVLLGAPGGGKSTALRHLALERLNRLLAQPDERLPLFVSLGDYKDGELLAELREFVKKPRLELSPLNFLRAHWLRWFGADGFERALDDGRLWLILDGLNEMPDRVNRVPDWQKFFDPEAGRFDPRNRTVIACRKTDYGNWFNLPQLVVEPLDPDRIGDFLRKRLGPDGGDAIMRRLEDDRDLLEVVSNPFWLKALADYAQQQAGRLPERRVELMDWFVDQWLVYGQGRADLPPLSRQDVEALKTALEPFAYWLLAQSDNAPVLRDEAKARCGVWAGRSAGEALDRAEAASLLVSETLREVKFYHQLVLEYFAGRELAQRFRRKESQAERWRIPWSNWSFVHSEWQRLSEPPTTRWEEATTFASARDEIDLDEFVRAVLAENPPLAARCILESGRDVKDAVREEVIERLHNLAKAFEPSQGLPAEASARRSLRIAAGRALGKLGDPRILKGQSRVTIDVGNEKQEITFIEPIWCTVKAGPFRMGSDTSGYAQERPEHTCDVIQADYAIGMFPVTNAEYECFVQARGYETEHYWTRQGWGWRRQDIKTAQPPKWVFWRRDWAKQNLDSIRRWPERGIGQPSEVEFYEAEAQRADEELIANWRRRELNMSRARNPWHTDRDTGGSNQPVVGVCWHEAMAYCKWLTDALRAAGRIKENQEVVLPNEPEWKKTAVPSPGTGEGQGVRAYPWGETFDPDRANTLDGRVLTTTPVGVYDNASACGAIDMSGNVWEWTRSRWGDDPEKPKFGYPYGGNLEERERPDADDYRIVRGGSWDGVASFARCAYRVRLSPGNRSVGLGFRCVLRSP